MDLVTVINHKFVKSAVNLLKSYKLHSYDKMAYVYWFGEPSDELSKVLIDDKVVLLKVPEEVEYAYNPKAFFYKTFALYDASKRTESFIYSDSANCFVQNARDLEQDLIDGSLLLPYNNALLTNQYWTTNACFQAIEGSFGSEWKPQYWAGFQVYNVTDSNRMMLSEMYEMSKIREVLLPDTSVKKPDGPVSMCVEHRQDQSILSLLVHKYDKHQHFDFKKTDKYGDWQTINDFDVVDNFSPNSKNRILMPRESKFGFYRYL
jgi:hypothetical protein